jgi:ketosteroid isomerase-like protein
MDERDLRNIDVVRRFYATERELAARDIVWHVPGHNPVSGIYTGADEYFDLMPSRMAPLDEWSFDLREIMVNGDYVMTTIHVKGTRKGNTIDLEGGHLFRLDAEGRVAEGWGFLSDQDALDAFFSA